MRIKPDQRIGTELVRWQFVERHSRKGYLDRDFFIGSRLYRWTSNSVSRDGLIRYGILDSTYQREPRKQGPRTKLESNLRGRDPHTAVLDELMSE